MALSCGDVDPASVQNLDSIDAWTACRRSAMAVARERAKAEDFKLDAKLPPPFDQHRA